MADISLKIGVSSNDGPVKKAQSGYFYTETTTGTTVAFYTIGDTEKAADSVQVAGLTSVNASSPTKIWIGTDRDVSVGAPDASTVYIVSGGTGNNEYEFSTLTSTGSQITAGSGADSISVNSGTTLTLGAGKDVVSIKGTNNVITDYDYTADHINLGAKYDALTVGDVGTSGEVKQASKTLVTVNAVSGQNFYAVTASDANNASSETYAWGGKNGSTIDLRGYTAKTNVFGTANDTKGDLIIGSDATNNAAVASKTDTGDSIIAGTNDSVFGGQGNDSISIAGNAVTVALFDQNFYGKVTGVDSVGNFKTGWDSTSDAVYVMDESGMTSTAIEDTDLRLHATAVNDSADNRSALILTPNSNHQSDSLNVKVNVAGTVKKYQFLGGKATSNNLKDAADVFVATATASATTPDTIKVAKGTTRTAVNMSNWGNDFIGDTTEYLVNESSYLVLDASEATQDIKLVGSSNNDTIKAGKAASSVWGGFGGDDSIVAGTGTMDVFFGTNNGNDSVKGYTSSDTITLYDASQQISGITKTADTGAAAGDLTVKFADGSSLALQSTFDSVNVKTQIGLNGDTLSAQFGGNNFTANKDKVAQYYYVTSNNTTATIKVTTDDNTSLWLAGSVDSINSSSYNQSSLVLADSSTFTGLTMDASASKGDVVLAGSTTNDTIKGSQGNSTLFGGTGNDVLIGDESGVGVSTFLYGKGMGNDTIWTSNKSDKVTLYDVAASDIASYKIDNTTNGALLVTLTDGSTLTVNNFGTKGTNSITTTDHTYTYDYTTETWTVK